MSSLQMRDDLQDDQNRCVLQMGPGLRPVPFKDVPGVHETWEYTAVTISWTVWRGRSSKRSSDFS